MEQLKTIEEAEKATGRTRSDIMRRCYEVALSSVVAGMRAERQAAYLAFNAALKETAPGPSELPHETIKPGPAVPKAEYRNRKPRRKVA